MSGEQQLTEEQRKQLEEKIKNMSPEELAQFQKQQCIFCQIIAGKIPSKKVYEDKHLIAVLDVNPAAKGHVLVIPKEHYAILPQIPDSEVQHFFNTAKDISQALLKALKVSGTNIFVANGLAAGQRSQHFLLHVIPRQEGDGVMQFEENLIDKSMQQNVVDAVQNKLNELLGIKKEVVKEQPKKIVEEPEEGEDSKEEPEAKNDESSEESEELEDNSEEDEKPDLDQIASLFK